jgi:hypothetical protein
VGIRDVVVTSGKFDLGVRTGTTSRISMFGRRAGKKPVIWSDYTRSFVLAPILDG